MTERIEYAFEVMENKKLKDFVKEIISEVNCPLQSIESITKNNWGTTINNPTKEQLLDYVKSEFIPSKINLVSRLKLNFNKNDYIIQIGFHINKSINFVGMLTIYGVGKNWETVSPEMKKYFNSLLKALRTKYKLRSSDRAGFIPADENGLL